MQKKSFTLVELMIVIAILAILSAIVIFALNPARLFDNFRDSKRVTDISSINKAIVFMESWNQSGITYGTSTNVYISLPDSSSTCSSYSLPTLPIGYNYYCSNPTTYKNTDGTGWIPINFTVEGSNRYLSSLPIDPVNNSSFFYTYYSGGSYELTAILSNPNKNSINDEGSLTSTFEIGSPNRTFNTPLQRDKGLTGLWDFNETSGTIAYDKSGNSNNGTFGSAPARTVLASGEKVLYFDGVDDFVSVKNLLPNGDQFTIATWVYWADVTSTTYPGPMGYWGGDSSTGNYAIIEYSSVSNGVAFRVRNGVVPLEAATSPRFASQINNWYFTVGTFDKPSAKLYMNGSLYGTATLNYSVTVYATTTYYLGYNSFSRFKGNIDGSRIYSRALSAEEIAKIYNTEKGRYGL